MPRARKTPLGRRKLDDLYGALPATKPYTSTDAVRKEVGRRLGEDLRRRLKPR
jgi:hypothetical protein